MPVYVQRNGFGVAEESNSSPTFFFKFVDIHAPSDSIFDAALPLEDFDDPNINREEALAGYLGQ